MNDRVTPSRSQRFMRRCAAVFCSLAASAFVLSGHLAEAQDEPSAGKQVAQKLVSKADPKSSLSYWLSLPKEYGTDNREWPVMLFLHGAGERGEDLKVVKVHGPPKLIDQGVDLPFIVVSPQCPKNHWWPGDVQQHLLVELLDDVLTRFKADRRRVVVTGLSMGGFGSWELTARYPQVFAAAVPICGRGDPGAGERLKSVPFWVFHGAKDFGVPLRYSELMVDAVTKAGGKAKLTVYPEAGHDSWTETYKNNAVYDWLLEQRRAEPVTVPIAASDVSFRFLGSIQRSLGAADSKQGIEMAVYLAAPRGQADRLQVAVDQHRDKLVAQLGDAVSARSFDDLKGLAGMRRAQDVMTRTAKEVVGDSVSDVRVLLDMYFITLDKKLQLDP